jgi:sensor histidine kinase regulating citrate/malate metabolism
LRAADFFEGARAGIWALVSLIIPAAAVWIWRDFWWPPVVLILWTAVAALIFIALERRKLQAQNVRMLEHAHKTFIRTLSRHRHDWLNDLQILYGYLKLNKPDKAANVVDRIRERMESDSRISQLGHPELSVYLLSFRTVCDHVRLDVRISEAFALDHLDHGAGPFASGLISLINLVRTRAVPSGARENVLQLNMSQTDGTLRLEVIFEGNWVPGQSMAEAAENLFGGIGQLTEKEGDEDPGGNWRILVTFPLTA